MASRGGATRPNGPNAGNKICQFKLVLLGESAVGKSSLVLRFVKGQFHEFQESTIGGEANVHWNTLLKKTNVFASTILQKRFKGAVRNSNPIHVLSNSVNCLSPSSSCPFCVCTQKKPGDRIQPWPCKWETKWLEWSHTLFKPVNTLPQEYGSKGFHLIGFCAQISATFSPNRTPHL